MSSVGLRLAPRARLAVSHLQSRLGTRSVHERRALLYPVDGGLGEFLPPAALKMIAVDYQDGLLQRLNEEVRGTEDQNKSVVQTVINTSQHREKTLAFNYASLALNNSFFLDQLKPPPAPPAKNHQSEISTHLAGMIRTHHGSIGSLKSSFSAAVMGMFTSGWVWFVTDKNGNTGVIPTFGPGTLLIRSRSYMAHSKGLLLGEDLLQIDRGDPYIPKESYDPADNEAASLSSGPTTTPQPSSSGVPPSSPSSGISGLNNQTKPKRLLPRFFHSSTHSSYELDRMPLSVWGEEDASMNRNAPRGKVDMLNIGEVLHPLFCISVNEHAWISAGYGVWGKEEWLKKFWTVLDWSKVSMAYEDVYKDRSKF